MDNNLPLLDGQYQKFIANINEWLPEGITDVNLELLHKFGLLHYHTVDKDYRPLTRYFQVIETPEKITLINDQFVIWIVPEKTQDTPITYTFIALNQADPQKIQLEIAFSTWGIYNSSRLVLRVLEKFLYEIQETEKILYSLKKNSSTT